MLPSKIRPTTSPSRLTTGLPELPPMMSAVETKLNGVSSFRRPSSLASTQLGGSSNGGAVAVRLGVLEGPADSR